jgi:type VI secretion system secreted protein VgrG
MGPIDGEAPMPLTTTLTHAERQFKVSTSLGKDTLLFVRMTATERLSSPYEVELELLSEKATIDPKQILGTPVAVSIELPGGGDRYLHGLVSDFSYGGHGDEVHTYHATLRPWLWFLTRRADCRIFQTQTTPEIVKQVFRDAGFTDFKDTLSRTYQTWEYCVQYRETDFNFVSRLMEHEGIYYYFEHTENKHTLVLADIISSHGPSKGYASVPYYPPEQSRRSRDHIFDWTVSWEAESGKYSHTDFDFTKPTLGLRTEVSDPRSHAHAQEEVYDYPGIYYATDAGGSLARVRIDELRAKYEVAQGEGDARGLAVGALFKLTGHPREDQDREYLITATTCHANSNEYASGAASTETDFACSFAAIPSNQQFRPPRLTPKPIVTGPQTAIVVGPGGEEIYTDKYGRVKVQFHWDRQGKKDENSSCWIRVAQIWAGKSWGGVFIPRIGQEVIVDFLEGDPDRPIITGRVYNAANMPPYGLPGEMTKSTIKSDSSKGGGGSNEIRFEDKKGNEEIYVHAQKDRNLVIEHDESKKVGNDRKKDIGHDETTHVAHDRTETVDNNETITVGANRTETVQKDETITINGNRTEQVAKDETITISGNRTESVSKDESITIGGNRTESVSKDESISISGGRMENVSKDESITISGARTVSIGKDDTQSISKKLTISAGDEIALTCGSATIVMKSSGDITINGAKIAITGSGDVILKGSKISEN